jgi:cytochrome c peroxidase
VEVVQKDSGYHKAFRRAFPKESDDGITFDNIAKAIGAFERTLVTPSRWDQFVNGESSALTEPELAGFQKFVAIGCAICHKGVYLGGDRYRMLGSRVPWPKTNDLGRYRVTGALSDKMVFKVAALRNVERTGPYFHDGSVGKLDEAVKLMARHQLGLELGDEDVQSIVTWLGSLTGTISADLLASGNDDSR